MQSPTGKRVPIQSAWVVNDLEAAAERWSTTLGIGPFFRARYRPDDFREVIYRDAPGELAMNTAITYAGGRQIELIEPVGDAPSPYRDTVPAGNEGFHHLCIWSTDVDADVAHYAALGFGCAVRARVGSGRRFAYVDTTPALGGMLELLEHDASIADLFDSWQRRCADWDGKELIIDR